jgi:2-haloacid dehalogenase
MRCLVASLAYASLLAVVYKRLSEEWGVPASWEECLAYGRSVRDWPAFADSVQALQYLKQHYKLVILSNVDNDSFVNTSEARACYEQHFGTISGGSSNMTRD